MARSQNELLEQEVDELTQMLHHEDVLAPLRRALENEGLPTTDVLLAGFLEDEDEHEYGAVVTSDGRVFEYERETRVGAEGFSSFVEMQDVALAIEHYPAVAVALRRVKGAHDS